LGAAGPVFTIILAVLIINEPFTLQRALGVALVLIGVACVSLKK
jgi:drug/metabolite transporter (DMT)-like permease